MPMTDDDVRAQVNTADGWLEFHRYFVERQCRPEVRGFAFAGLDAAHPHPDFIEIIGRKELRAIVICPSNPFVSIETIMALPGVRQALRDCEAPVIAVAPVIGAKAVKGPTAKMMQELGLEVSAAAVARLYEDFLDGYVVDHADAALTASLDMRTVATEALLISLADRENLARAVLQPADRLSGCPKEVGQTI